MARILLIDDEESFRQTIRLSLEQAGYEVLEARDGEEGIRIHHAERPDLIITDLIMPEMEGIETIIALRRHDPNAKIIAISGGGRINANDFLSMACKFGARHAFTKPVRREELLEAIRESLAESAA